MAFTDAAGKVTGPTTTTPPDPSAMMLSDDWQAEIPARLTDLVAAWRAPGPGRARRPPAA